MNVGIREQLMVSVAGGLGLAGLRPLVHTYAPFLVERAWEQVKLDVTHQDVPAVLVSVGASYDAAAAGRTHQAPGDVALFDTLPGWAVHVPGHPAEVPALLRAAVASGGRAYVRLTTATNTRPHADTRGGLVSLHRGRQGAVVAVGPMLDPVLAATEGLDVSVLYAATVRPLDTATLRAAVDRPVLSVVEPYAAGTSAWAVTRAFRDLPHRLDCHGVASPETHRYGNPADHARLHGLDVPALRARLAGFHAGG